MATRRELKEERRSRLAAAREAAGATGSEPRTPAGPRRPTITRRQAVGALVLAAMVGIAFMPAYQAGFVWDDVAFSEEPIIRSPSGLRNIWFSPGDIRNEGHYWPLTYTSFWLEDKLWGRNPLGYHVVNVALYLANVLLLWQLGRRMAIPGAWAVAALWAVHPLHVESVVWIIERKDVLSGLFYLCSALIYIRFHETGKWNRYAVSLSLYALGLLAKSAVVTLPAALLIWHWWQRGRLTVKDALRTAPFFLVGLAISLGDMAFYRSREVLSLDYSLLERVLIAARALWFYAVKLVWPSNLAIIHPRWNVDTADPLAWACLAAAAAVAAALWFARGRFGRAPLAGALFFAVTLSPTLGFVSYGYMQFSFVADRFQYLAGFGLIAVLVGAAARAVKHLPPPGRRAVPVVLATVLMAYGTVTWRQARVYRDEVTLFGHIVSLNPEARDAHLNWSAALHKVGRFEESFAASRIAVEQRPESANAHSNLGRAFLRLNDFEEAEASFDRALAIDPKHRNANQNRAEAMRKQGRVEEAIAQFRAVLEMDGDFPLAWAGMSDALFRAGRFDESLDAAHRALAIDPDLSIGPALYLTMGKAARAAGRLDEAEEYLLRATELVPDGHEPLLELANVASARERPEEADRYMARAEALQPLDPVVLHQRAEALRVQKRFDDAQTVYRQALDIDPEFAPALAGLGALMFQLDRTEEAVELLGRGLSLDPNLAEAAALHRLLGRGLQVLGRRDEAATQFARTLELSPHDIEALDHLAFLRFHEERYEDALRLYRTLTEADASNRGARTNLGITLLKLNRYAEAAGVLEEVLATGVDDQNARRALAEARNLAQGRQE